VTDFTQRTSHLSRSCRKNNLWCRKRSELSAWVTCTLMMMRLH